MARINSTYLMKFIVIIPARYQSTRFPGKPLAKLGGKPVIQWVCENAASAIEDVWVATDDQRIFDKVESFGGKAIFTSPDHKSGTDRCAEAADILKKNIDFDVVINIQGDEPFVQPSQLEALKSCFDGNVSIVTLIRKITKTDELLNPNRPKVVIDNKNFALYFSRSPIPYMRGKPEAEWINYHEYWGHVGMYAYTYNVLKEITQLKPGKLEETESLEQLRWIENNFRIKTAETNFQSIGIDSPADLKEAELLIK